MTIRPPEPGDAALLIAGRDEEFARWLGPGSDTPEPLACIEQAGAVIGWVDVDPDRPWLNAGKVNLGYHLFSTETGHGYATRAAMLLLHHLRVRTDHHTATVLIDPANVRSLALAGRCGFKRRGVVGDQVLLARPVRQGPTVARVEERTRKLWAKQDQHEGDRWRLFTAVAGAIEAERVLYPGSYVDVAPSFVFSDVSYVDSDKRAAQFFADEAGVAEIIAEHSPVPDGSQFHFIHSDYTADLGLEDESFGLLVSLYAGFISEACTRYLRVGGALLVNPSHGDASMAAIDDRYELAGVVTSRSGDYRVRTDDLDGYLIPQAEVEVTCELLHERGRGVAYTKPAFAYLFTRVD